MPEHRHKQTGAVLLQCTGAVPVFVFLKGNRTIMVAIHGLTIRPRVAIQLIRE